MNTPNPTKDKLMKVTLLKDGHTHAGKVRAKGDEIEVTEAQAKWLGNPKRGLIAPITKEA